MNKINKLAIFCGSKKGGNELYGQHALELASIMAEHRIELVYGGGKKGIMGVVADTVMEKGGTVRGVIPQILVGWEHQHEGISELFVVEDMHVRKRKMYELCDGVVILAGGLAPWMNCLKHLPGTSYRFMIKKFLSSIQLDFIIICYNICSFKSRRFFMERSAMAYLQF